MMRKPLALVGALVLALVVVGCGSSSGSDDSAKTTTTKAKAATTTTVDDGSTTTPSSATTKPTPADGTESEYLAALVTNLSTGSTEDGNLVISADEADCVAPKWLDTVTTEGFQNSGATPDQVSDPSFQYNLLDLDQDQGQALIDSFDSCGVDIYAKLAEGITVGLTDEQQACAMKNVDADVANALLLTAFSTKAGDGDAEFTALLDQLSKVCKLPAN